MPGRRRGTRGFPAAPRQRPRESFFNASRPCSPRDSEESSATPQFKSINSLLLSFLQSPTLTFIHPQSLPSTPQQQSTARHHATHAHTDTQGVCTHTHVCTHTRAQTHTGMCTHRHTPPAFSVSNVTSLKGPSCLSSSTAVLNSQRSSQDNVLF